MQIPQAWAGQGANVAGVGGGFVAHILEKIQFDAGK